MKRPLIRNQRTAIVLGIGLFLLGSWFLYDAFERRGKDTPHVFRPFTWW